MTQGKLGTAECGGWYSGLVKGCSFLPSEIMWEGWSGERQQLFAGVNLRSGRDFWCRGAVQEADSASIWGMQMQQNHCQWQNWCWLHLDQSFSLVSPATQYCGLTEKSKENVMTGPGTHRDFPWPNWWTETGPYTSGLKLKSPSYKSRFWVMEQLNYHSYIPSGGELITDGNFQDLTICLFPFKR